MYYFMLSYVTPQKNNKHIIIGAGCAKVGSLSKKRKCKMAGHLKKSLPNRSKDGAKHFCPL